MAYYTAAELRAEAGLTASVSAEALRREARSTPERGRFDVFLSHSFNDAQVIYGLRRLLMAEGLTVYVDWIDDPLLDRSNVSAATARRLRTRMQQSSTLIYATSRSASRSRWMPWELGYFDGARSAERISIVPIENHESGEFTGQEYLSLYKRLEKISVAGMPRPFAVDASTKRGEPLSSFATGAGRYVQLG